MLSDWRKLVGHYDKNCLTVSEVDFPKKLQFLFHPNRYKIAYGGRGGAKSWGFARALLVLAAQKPIRVLCAREIQKSIQDSVHKLLADQISDMGLQGFFEIQKTAIYGKNGSEFLFAGLRHNISNLKSYEGVDIVWIEEAQSVSKASWDVLIPTIRKPDSEIWLSFNPDLEDDETYQRFVMTPPTGAIVEKISYQDNPWFPDVLRQEMEDCRRKSESDYLHIWDGQCRQAVDGAIFAGELNIAAEEHRITRVPVQSGIPVHTFHDLGQSDNYAIWFSQLVGMEYRLVDYYQNSGHKVDHYVDVLAKRGYYYGDHYLPHDSEHEQLAARKSVAQQYREALHANPKLGMSIKVIPRIPQKFLAIDAARQIFGRCLFDKDKCTDGLQCLRRYRFAKDPETGKVGKEPMHDIYSHGADAFMQMAQYARPHEKAEKPPVNTGWIV